MASLVLGVAGSALGGALGGPLGAAIGQLVGSAIGNMLFPQKQEGPRLNDLKLQDSQYGKMIPIAYGRVRLSGNVIWQTDLEEHSETSSGKGGPEVTTYTYTASFAVQICEGPIIGVTRIWADGRIIHDSSSYTSQTSIGDSILKVYFGTEDQLPDPTMESVLGAGNVPAYRGYAYAVFTDLEMGDFGNRIPNLEFEVITVGPVNSRAHIVAENDEIGQMWQWDSGDGGGIGIPCIESWVPGGSIVIKNMTPGMPSHEYSAADLTHIRQVAYLGPGSTSPGILVKGDSLEWVYRSAGRVTTNGIDMPVFVDLDFVTQAGNTDVALAGGTVFTPDGLTVQADYELGVSAGLPSGLYVGGVVFTQDKTAMMVFVGSSGFGPLDGWYMVENGSVIAAGTVEGSQLDMFTAPMGNYSAKNSYWCAMLENNRRYMWYVADAPDMRHFKVFKVDDSGHLAIDPVALVVQLNDVLDEPLFCRPSCYAFKEGYCGAVFGKQLAIASRFPVFERDGPPLSEVVADLSNRAGLLDDDGSPTLPLYNVASLANDYVDGYVLASQGAVRSAIDQLRAAYFFDAVESDGVVKFVKRGSGSVVEIPDDDLAAHGDGEEVPAKLSLTRLQEVELPRVYTINFIDRESDYQTGSQQDRREVTLSALEKSAQLAIVMTPTRARRIAQLLLFDDWIERERAVFTTSRKYSHLEPTDVVTVRGRVLRLTSRKEGAQGLIEWEGVAAHTRMWVGVATGAPQSGYTPVAPPVQQPSDLMLLDIPLLRDSDEIVGYYVAMAGRQSAQWRGATLFRSDDAGVNYASVMTSSSPATMGYTTTVLGDFVGGNVFDEFNSVEVQLGAGSGELSSNTQQLVLNGANTAIVGSEVLRFKTATLIDTKAYRLTGLLRGRRGTEWAMGGHQTSERFALLSTVVDQAMPPAFIGAVKYYKAVSTGQALADADQAIATVNGVRNKPFAPVHLGGGLDSAGDTTLTWKRRTRIGGAWIDGSDVPLGENIEEYVVEIWNAAYTECARVITGITSQSYEYTAAMQSADFGAAQLTIYFKVAQKGSYGLGYAAAGSAPGSGASNVDPSAPVPPQTGGIDPLPPSNVDEAHFANFLSLYNAGGRDRELAFWYSSVGPVHAIGWYGRYIPTIIDIVFGGDFYAFSTWTNASFDAGSPNSSEAGMLLTLAQSAE